MACTLYILGTRKTTTFCFLSLSLVQLFQHGRLVVVVDVGNVLEKFFLARRGKHLVQMLASSKGRFNVGKNGTIGFRVKQMHMYAHWSRVIELFGRHTRPRDGRDLE